MRWVSGLVVFAVVGVACADERFTNRQGTHTLTVKDGEIYHAMGNPPGGLVNGETAKAANGNRVRGVVAVAGTGFDGLDDIHVVAVDRDGKVWHTARLPDGTWLRWGDVSDEVGGFGVATRVTCTSTGRNLLVTVGNAAGAETRCIRTAVGRWTAVRP
ncbi:MAG TPA: hypothetical protein VH092_36430 [Urbifossiella sp.]|jgi:hypothetical protein|nr:hypothetical protein [Urbifossiella sp.]